MSEAETVRGLVAELLDEADIHGDIEQSTAVAIATNYERQWQAQIASVVTDLREQRLWSPEDVAQRLTAILDQYATEVNR